MSVQTPTDEMVSTDDAQPDNLDSGSDPRDDYILIGTDTDGCDHIYRTTDETVHVIEDGARVWIQELDPEDEEQDVNAWIGHIADCRGWESQELYRTMAGALMGAL